MALEVKKNFNEEKESWIIYPIGELDIYTSPNFKETLKEVIEEKKVDITIDGRDLDYIDSTGLGVLIGALKNLKEYNKNIIVTNIKPNIKKLFDITGLNKVFIVKG